VNVTDERVSIVATDNRRLEALLSCREDVMCAARVVLSCPHPYLGGTPDNPVILAMRRGFSRASAAALTWTYHAIADLAAPARPTDHLIPQSITAEADVEREAFWRDQTLVADQADVRDHSASRAWLEAARLGGERGPALLAGYSYGALVALTGARRGDHLFLVAPPLRALPPDWAPPADLSVIILSAEDDLALSPNELRDFIARWPLPSIRTSLLAGADHFMLDHLGEIESAALAWAAGSFADRQQGSRVDSRSRAPLS
jgi:alpha/beta superfamily hydrolase